LPSEAFTSMKRNTSDAPPSAAELRRRLDDAIARRIRAVQKNGAAKLPESIWELTLVPRG
jgi:hypothetical protein